LVGFFGVVGMFVGIDMLYVILNRACDWTELNKFRMTIGMFVGIVGIDVFDVFDVFDGDSWCDSETSSEWQ